MNTRTRRLVGGLMIFGAVVLGAYVGRGPFVESLKQQELSRKADADMVEAEHSYAESRAKEATGTNRVGREEMVRSMGWRKPNEKVLPER